MTDEMVAARPGVEVDVSGRREPDECDGEALCCAAAAE